MSDNEDRSLLATHIWDLRASLEEQVRCLAVIQHTLMAFRKATDGNVRAELRAKMLREFADVEGLSFSVLRMIKPTIEEARRELFAV
jgi:hypothetical protein